jgi:2,5-diamino-6-(ribosylamino)-4(3H)-pyrimidinone 5'-phosphate reductase
MIPKIIIHNSMSLDGSLTNFEPNMELHYRIAGKYNEEAHLIGSNTVKVGAKLYGDVTPEKRVISQNRRELRIFLTGLYQTLMAF